MFIDYQTLVLRDYEKKKAENLLSHRLVHPTAANIREECIAVCTERYLSKDEHLLREFLGKRDSPGAYIQAFKKQTDKFKPLVNFLKKQITNTDTKNVELLAWLIDFEPRPYQLGTKYNVGEITVQKDTGNSQNSDMQEVEEIREKEDEEEQADTPVDDPVTFLQPIPPQKKKPSSILKIALWIISPPLTVLIGAYWLSPGKYPRGKGDCMYWAYDHYEQVSCDQKPGDAPVIALDTFKLNHFRKITRPDTITGYSIGSVWYVKVDRVDRAIEFYTADGYHPIQQEKQLKPLTEYIIIKYIRPTQNKTAGQNVQLLTYLSLALHFIFRPG
ncbi:hypothetical protein [Chitinophaga vietnamensis]|nr:hypothetical protein [Chitinophaga vietnamensis]